MGVLVADNLKFNIGLTLNNFVITIRGNLRMIEKSWNSEGLIYKTYYRMLFYASQAAYESNDAWLQEQNDMLILTAEQIKGNIFTHIYDHIKTLYNSTSDV